MIIIRASGDELSWVFGVVLGGHGECDRGDAKPGSITVLASHQQHGSKEASWKRVAGQSPRQLVRLKIERCLNRTRMW
jgi:hypothetical protein